MTDRQRPLDDFDPALIAALRDEAYREPLTLDPARLRARASAARRPVGADRLRWPAFAAVLAIVAVAALAVAFLRSATPVGPMQSAGCEVSAVTRHGGWWTEVGGPNAYFGADPTRMYAGTAHTWLIHVRFDPDVADGQHVAMSAERVGTDQRIDARLDGRVDSRQIFRHDQPAPDLPGGWYLFEQPFPTPGCWRLTATIDGRVVGSAVVQVNAAAAQDTPDLSGPTPRVDASPSPLPSRWGPLVVSEANFGMEALAAGTLEITDECTFLRERGGERVLLVWPAGETAWDPFDRRVTFGSRPDISVLHSGDMVALGGGGSSVSEGGPPPEDWVTTIEWANPPAPECITDARWFVSSVVSVSPATSPDGWRPVPERWGYLADADIGLSVHSLPNAGSAAQDTGVAYFYVIGEQTVDGQVWQRVEYRHERQEMVFGWVAATRAELVRSDQVCYGTDFASLPAGDPAKMAECYAGQTLEIGPVLIRPLDVDPVVRGQPQWLAEQPRLALYDREPPVLSFGRSAERVFVGSSTAVVDAYLPVHLPPELLEQPLASDWVTVTAHVDDPRSGDCRRDPAAAGFSAESPFEQELWCRQQLVVSAIAPADPPPTPPPPGPRN